MESSKSSICVNQNIIIYMTHAFFLHFSPLLPSITASYQAAKSKVYLPSYVYIHTTPNPKCLNTLEFSLPPQNEIWTLD